MKFRTIYSIILYMFIGCVILWLICGLGYKFFFYDAVEKSRSELTQALNLYFPRDYYMIDGEVYDSNRKNLLSIGQSINIKKDLQHTDLKSIVPLSGNWTLIKQNESRCVYESQSYRIYVTKNTQDDGYIVVLTHNNWLEILHL